MDLDNVSLDYEFTFNDLENGTYTPYDLRLETYIVPALFFFIFVIGILGNGTLVAIFIRHKEIRSIPNMYIFSMVLADLLIITTTVPFVSMLYSLESWPWGLAMCKMSELLKDVNTGVSVFTLTALSFERYSVIVRPFQRFQTKRMTIIMSGMIWVIAIFLALPHAYFSTLLEISFSSNQTVTFCAPYPEIANQVAYMKINVTLKALIYYFIPLFIITLYYSLMAFRLCASADEVPEVSGAHREEQTKAGRHLAKMVLIIAFLFFICFLPHHVFMLWFHFNPDLVEAYDEWWHAIRIVGFCLSFLHSCVNPIALYCVSGTFRAYFNRYLCCRNSKCLEGALCLQK